MTKTTPPDVAAAWAAARAWADRSGGRALDALGAAWLATRMGEATRDLERDVDAIEDVIDRDHEIAPAEASMAMHPAPHPADAIMKRQLVAHVHDLLLRLPARTERMLRLRFGIGGGEPMTLAAIGREPGARVSAERAKQIVERGLRDIVRGERMAEIRAVATGDLGALVDERAAREEARMIAVTPPRAHATRMTATTRRATMEREGMEKRAA